MKILKIIITRQGGVLFMLDWIATSTAPDWLIDKVKELKKG